MAKRCDLGIMPNLDGISGNCGFTETTIEKPMIEFVADSGIEEIINVFGTKLRSNWD